MYDDYDRKGQLKLWNSIMRDEINDVDVNTIKTPGGKKHHRYYKRIPHPDNDKKLRPLKNLNLDKSYYQKQLLYKDTKVYPISEEKLHNLIKSLFDKKNSNVLFKYLTMKEIYYISLITKSIWKLMDTEYWVVHFQARLAYYNSNKISPVEYPFSYLSQYCAIKNAEKNFQYAIYLNKQNQGSDPMLNTTSDISLVTSGSGINQIEKSIFRPEKLGHLQGLSVGENEVYLWQYAWVGIQPGTGQVHGTYKPEGEIEKAYFLDGEYFIIESCCTDVKNFIVKYQICLFKTVCLDIFDVETDLETLKDNYYPLAIIEYITPDYVPTLSPEEENEDIIKINCKAIEQNEFKVSLGEHGFYIFKKNDKEIHVFDNSGNAKEKIKIVLPELIQDINFSKQEDLVLGITAENFHTIKLPKFEFGKDQEIKYEGAKKLSPVTKSRHVTKCNWLLTSFMVDGNENAFFVQLQDDSKSIKFFSLDGEKMFEYNHAEEISCFNMFESYLITYSDDDLINIVEINSQKKIYSYKENYSAIKGFYKIIKQIYVSKHYYILTFTSDHDIMTVHYKNWSMHHILIDSQLRDRAVFKGEFSLQGSCSKEKFDPNTWEVKFFSQKLLIMQYDRSFLVDFCELRPVGDNKLDFKDLWKDSIQLQGPKQKSKAKIEKEKIKFSWDKQYHDLNVKKFYEEKRLSDMSALEKLQYEVDEQELIETSHKRNKEKEEKQEKEKLKKKLQKKLGKKTKIDLGDEEEIKSGSDSDEHKKNKKKKGKKHESEESEEEIETIEDTPAEALTGQDKVRRLLKDYAHDKNVYRYNYRSYTSTKQDLQKMSEEFVEKKKAEQKAKNLQKKNQFFE